jgi:hypothetical protein
MKLVISLMLILFLCSCVNNATKGLSLSPVESITDNNPQHAQSRIDVIIHDFSNVEFLTRNDKKVFSSFDQMINYLDENILGPCFIFMKSEIKLTKFSIDEFKRKMSGDLGIQATPKRTIISFIVPSSFGMGQVDIMNTPVSNRITRE